MLTLSVMTTETKPPLLAMYNMDELAEMFKVSRSTIYRLRTKDRWPHSIVGSEIRFSVEDIAAIRAKYHKQPPAEGTRAPRIPKRS